MAMELVLTVNQFCRVWKYVLDAKSLLLWEGLSNLKHILLIEIGKTEWTAVKNGHAAWINLEPVVQCLNLMDPKSLLLWKHLSNLEHIIGWTEELQ